MFITVDLSGTGILRDVCPVTGSSLTIVSTRALVDSGELSFLLPIVMVAISGFCIGRGRCGYSMAKLKKIV